MEIQKIGVVGVGHLGMAHLRNLIKMAGFEVIGFYDVDSSRADEITDETGIPSFDSLNSLLTQVDAVSVVTPTNTHFDI